MNREEKKIVGLMGCSHALRHGFVLIYPAVLLLLLFPFLNFPRPAGLRGLS